MNSDRESGTITEKSKKKIIRGFAVFFWNRTVKEMKAINDFDFIGNYEIYENFTILFSMEFPFNSTVFLFANLLNTIE